jgi:hypothetical protein
MTRTRNLGAYIPNCVTYDPYQIKTPADVVYILQHEIDLYDEGHSLGNVERGDS